MKVDDDVTPAAVQQLRGEAAQAMSAGKWTVIDGASLPSAVSQQQIAALISAVWQTLDDFGRDGQSVCIATKAHASRIGRLTEAEREARKETRALEKRIEALERAVQELHELHDQLAGRIST